MRHLGCMAGIACADLPIPTALSDNNWATPMTSKRYLVTGGCGFIGSHLCDALRTAGHAVRVLDDLSTGRRENLAAGAELVVADIGDVAAVRAAVVDVDGCFHLAAIASVERATQDWAGTHRVNLGGTVALFDAILARTDGRRVPVVYASSAAVYGDGATPPIAEDASCQPLSAYGADKYGSELHARVASHVHGIPTVGLRFFNVFGPRQDPASPYSGVISIFCERLLRDAELDVFGDGKQTRDFVYVSDVVAALLAAMAHSGTDAAVVAPVVAAVVNVCTGRPIALLELASAIASLGGRPARLRHCPERAGEIRHSTGSPKLLHAMLGVREPVALATGLARVLTWMQSMQAASEPMPHQPQDDRPQNAG